MVGLEKWASWAAAHRRLSRAATHRADEWRDARGRLDHPRTRAPTIIHHRVARKKLHRIVPTSARCDLRGWSEVRA